jgi:hypothetical protein
MRCMHAPTVRQHTRVVLSLNAFGGDALECGQSCEMGVRCYDGKGLWSMEPHLPRSRVARQARTSR